MRDTQGRDMEPVRALLAEGFNWRQIHKKTGYVRDVEISMRFTPEDDRIIAEEWGKNTHVNDIAAKLFRDAGTVRQRIIRLELPARNGALTRMRKRYGDDVMAFGETPTQIVCKTREHVAEAMLIAKQTVAEAKRKVHRFTLDRLRQQIADGVRRNDAIFEARCAGLTLNTLGEEFGVTHERIRQLCLQVALERAMQLRATNGKAKE
jgi:hypothetical protein